MAGQQLLEEHPALEPGQARAEAHVLAEPEGQVRDVGSTGDVEAAGRGTEGRPVPVGRGVEHHHEGPGGHRGAGQLHVHHGRPSEGLDRGHPPQQLLDGPGQQ